MRVPKLRAEGRIDGCSAQIKLGKTLTAFTEASLKKHRRIDFARFPSAVERLDQLVDRHLDLGGYDYPMKFRAAGAGEYPAIGERLSDMDMGVDKNVSFVVLKSPIVNPPMPPT